MELTMSSSLTAALVGFLLVLARVGAFVGAGPITSARFIPMRARFAIAVAVSFVAFVAAGAPEVDPARADLVVVGGEVVFGLVGGVLARLTLDASLAVGALLAAQVGLNFASTIDPTSGVQSDVLSDLLSLLTLASAVALDLHREAIALCCASVQTWPPGAPLPFVDFVEAATLHAIAAVALAARIAFPMIAVTSAGSLAMALIARGAPSLGMQGLGFTVPVLAGGFALYAFVPRAAELCARHAIAVVHGLR